MDPPYRLETATDIMALRTKVRFRGLDRALAFARRHELQAPPLLARLPARLDLPAPGSGGAGRFLTETAEADLDDSLGTLQQVRGLFRSAVLSRPESAHAAESRMLDEANELLGVLRRSGRTPGRTTGGGAEGEAPMGRISASLAAKDELYRTIAELIRIYAHTKDGRVVTLLERALPTIYSYDLDAEAIVDDGITSQRLLRTLHDAVAVRIPSAWRVFVGPYVLRYCSTLKGRIGALDVHSNIKTQLFANLNRISVNGTGESTLRALDSLVTTHRAALPAPAANRLAGLIGNLRSTVSTYETLIESIFHSRELSPVLSAALTDSDDRQETERLRHPQGLTLYPCKDYHELLKGHISQDCTVDDALAEAHVLSPVFLNVRIFDDRSWVGNVYLLDYSARMGTVVVDKVQMGLRNRAFTVRSLELLVTVLADALSRAGASTVLADPTISNRPEIVSDFAVVTASCARAPFRVPRSEQAFESYDCHEFVVLTR